MKQIIKLLLTLALVSALLLAAACTSQKESGSTTAPSAENEAPSATDGDSSPTEAEPSTGDIGTTPTEPTRIDQTPYSPRVDFNSCPEDMTPASASFVSERGTVRLTVTVDGYRSELLGKAFFLLHNEPIFLRVTVENLGETEIRKFLSTYCRENRAPTPENIFRHNHEIDYYLKDKKGNTLVRVAPYFDCPALIDTMTLPAGASETYYYTLAAGTLDSDFLHLSATSETDMEKIFADHVTPYGSDIFTTDGSVYSDTFRGEFSFSYIFSYSIDGKSYPSDQKTAVDVELEVLYFPEAEPTLVLCFPQ